MHVDVAVLGAGLMGRLISWQLAGKGLRVALYERTNREQVLGAAAWVAAAMLAPLAEAALSPKHIVESGWRSLQRWPAILADLPEPVFFQSTGTLVVWHSADRAESTLFANRIRANAPTAYLNDNFHYLDHQEAINAVEPALTGRFTQAFLLDHEGQLDNRQLLQALQLGLEQRGVKQYWGTPIEGFHQANWPNAKVWIDCRGLGAKSALPTLRGVRGEVARVFAPDVQLLRPVRLLHPRYPLYIAPRPHGHYVIGATEIESEDLSAVTVRSALELLGAAFAVHPAFGEARILELNSQCRPTFPDHCPAVIWDGAHTVQVNGLYRHGFLLAPEVADHTLSLVEAILAGAIDRGTDQKVWNDWTQRHCWPTLFKHGQYTHLQ
jgi:glycine oxidase